MRPLNLPDLAAVLGGELVGAADGTVSRATVHSARVPVGAAFFALQGERADGHDFVEAALGNGAVVAVVDRVVDGAGPLVVVPDVLASLQALAASVRADLTGTVVAVVGSNGKTTTKDALAALVASERSVYASPGSYNSQLGVALAVLDCPVEADVAVFELAVSEPGEMDRLERMVRPDAVVLTNVGARWQSHFDDAEHQRHELLVAARSASWVLSGEAIEGPTFSAPRFDGRAMAVEVAFPSGERGSVAVATPSEEVLADVELALAAAWRLGVSPAALLRAADGYGPTSMRTETWRSPSGVVLIRDVATPDPIAVSSVLRSAARLAGSTGRIGIVLAPVADPSAVAGLASALATEKVDVVYGPEDLLTALAGAGIHAVELTGVERVLDDTAPGDVVVVQSAPGTGITDLASAFREAMAPTRLYLDLTAIEHNVQAFRASLGPNVRILGMVKALAYGTDPDQIAAALQRGGIDGLAVAGVDEGVSLRRAATTAPILVMLPTPGELDKAARALLTPVVYSPEMVDAVCASGLELTVHVEVDTGMHRTGLRPDEAIEALRRLRDVPDVRVEGLMTHLASADEAVQDDFTDRQLARFDEVCEAAQALGFTDLVRHAAASSAALRMPGARYDMVRIGLGLHGIYPSADTRGGIELVPAVGLVSRIVETRSIPEGDSVGYGATWRAPRGGARVGVVSGGYADFIPRAFSNVGSVIVAGHRCPIIGRISMDSFTVDLGSCPDVTVGTDVLVYGRYGDWSIPLEEVAEQIGTIPYELMTRVGPRVQRIFTRH